MNTYTCTDTYTHKQTHTHTCPRPCIIFLFFYFSACLLALPGKACLAAPPQQEHLRPRTANGYRRREILYRNKAENIKFIVSISKEVKGGGAGGFGGVLFVADPRQTNLRFINDHCIPGVHLGELLESTANTRRDAHYYWSEFQLV